MSSERPSSGTLLSRRHFLWNTAGGLGGIALAWMLNREHARAAVSSSVRPPHFPPKIVFLFRTAAALPATDSPHFVLRPHIRRSNRT
jgi:hypothetical protein